ncbi:Pre-rRNA-processing protein IPI1/Testis-expressed sequence 10 protein [Trinorchestia longiramus]|nr:Pre-rRNA-processing protein IPI1/Testis-expressed sequence 10 protein [Trinorchestia longiramus]
MNRSERASWMWSMSNVEKTSGMQVMAKSQRSKREKQKDFVKKKVKVGKTLQKPQNETITTFKTRSIQILEQLGEKEAGPNVTQKRYSMTELCSRLGQKNPKQKLDACQGIKELFGKLSSDQIRLSLAELVAALSRNLLDDDCKVRGTTVRMLEMLIDKVGIGSLRPHFTLLGRHASCGLVSLHCDIQATALQLLHMLLRKAPQLLPLHASTVLPNLLRLLGAKTKSGAALQKVFTEGIGGATPSSSTSLAHLADKKKKNTKGGSNIKAATNTKATTNTKAAEEMVVLPGQMSSRHNSLMWQLDVLVLLAGVLQRVIQFDPGNSLTQPHAPQPTSRWQVILQSSSPNAAASSSLRVPGDGVAHFSNVSLLCEPSKLQSLSSTMLTIVHALWRNFLPSNTQLKGGVEMSNPSAHCLWCLVELQRSLSTLVTISSGAKPEQERTCRWWFSRFRKGNFNLKVEVRGGRLKKLDLELLEAAVTENSTVTSRELANLFDVTSTTVVRQLKQMGNVSVFGKWVPHELSPENLCQRVSCCESLP